VRRLARRRLALPGHKAVAEQHFIHFLGRDAGARHGRLDRGGAEIVRGQAREIAMNAPMGVRAAPTMTMGSCM